MIFMIHLKRCCRASSRGAPWELVPAANSERWRHAGVTNCECRKSAHPVAHANCFVLPPRPRYPCYIENSDRTSRYAPFVFSESISTTK